MALKSQSELLQLFIDELQARDPSLTDDNEGSKLDVLGGAFSVAVAESQRTSVEEFKKTYIDTSEGDNLEFLLVDHFGSSFARPEASKATGTVTFSRANTDEGNVTIPVGTIVATVQNAAGNSTRFEVIAEVVMTGTTIDASVRALVAGTDGNVDDSTVTVIESSLTDSSVVVTNALAFGDGTETLNDAEYRQFARNLLLSLRGATLDAIVATALTVSGITTVTGIEFSQYVKEWNISTGTATGDYFKIARVKLYVADVNGVASAALLAAVETAIEPVRAAGVNVEVLAAVAVELDWTAEITLNPAGPNYATFVSNAQAILDTMELYLQGLSIGTDFDKSTADAYIISLWGGSGTGDLTDFTTTIPVGNVSADANEKIIPGTMAVE
jgi:hypothetical protein